MKKEVQDKIDAIIAMAKASNLKSTSRSKSSLTTQDSLSKAIRNKEDADKFLKELEIVIKYGQEKE